MANGCCLTRVRSGKVTVLETQAQVPLLSEFSLELQILREGILEWVQHWRAGQEVPSDAKKWDHYLPEYLNWPNLKAMSDDPMHNLLRIVYNWVSTDTSRLPAPGVAFATGWSVILLCVDPYLSDPFYCYST